MDKYTAYLKIGRALKDNDIQSASVIAQIIIKSDKQHAVLQSLSDNYIICTEEEEQVLSKF